MATPDKRNKKLFTPEVNDMVGELYGDLEKAYEVGVQDASKYLKGMPQPPSFQTAEITAPNKPVSDYQYNQNLINSILKEPMDAATEEKRARSAYAIGGIGALGNAFSAFSNLVFTGQGAPSQTLPTLPDTYGLVKDMQDRNQKDRENYLRYKTAARNADRSEWAQDQQLYGQQIDRKNNLAKSQYEIDSNRYKWGVEQQQKAGARAENRAGTAFKYAQEAQNHEDSMRLSRDRMAMEKAFPKDEMDLKSEQQKPWSVMDSDGKVESYSAPGLVKLAVTLGIPLSYIANTGTEDEPKNAIKDKSPEQLVDEINAKYKELSMATRKRETTEQSKTPKQAAKTQNAKGQQGLPPLD